MSNSKSDYFFCYSARLKNRLLDAGERYICVGLNESTKRKFWLFPQSDTIGEVIADHVSNSKTEDK